MEVEEGRCMLNFELLEEAVVVSCGVGWQCNEGTGLLYGRVRTVT
jgi:hypothetical protein